MTNHDSDPKGPALKKYAMTPIAASVVAAMNPGTAIAQDDEDKSLGIEEIVVTATKRSVSIQDVAQSITAFSTAEISRRGILDMADVAVNLPSISLSSNRAGRNELVYRGISNGGSWRLDSQVAMYLDEMPMTMSTTQLDARMVDIERIESLPGPQGTLFGSSSQAGTLRVITNKPRFDAFAGEVVGEYKTTSGGEDGYDVNGFINIPVSDSFAIRMVAYANKDGGYIDNVYSTSPHSDCSPPTGADRDPDTRYCDHDFAGYGGVDNMGYANSQTPDNAGLEEENYNDYEMVGGRIAGLWNMNDRWSLLTTLMHQDSETTGVWYSDTAIGDFKVARFSDEWRKDTWSTLALQLDGDLGFARLTNSFGYADREQSYAFDNTHYEAYHTRLKGQYWSVYANYWANYYYYAYGTPVPQYNYYDKYDTDYNGGIYSSLQESKRITNELRLTSTSDSRFQWMVGAFYENFQDGWDDQGEIPNLESTKHWDYTQFRSCELVDEGVEGVTCPAQNPGNTWYRDLYDRDVTQIAVFSEVDYNFTDTLKLTAGARWFQYDRYVINDRQWPLYMPVEAILVEGETVSVEEGKEDDTTWKLGLSWNLSDDAMVYGLYSQGFRLGGRNNPKAVRVNFVPEFYDPDKLNNYEIGMKTEWFDNRLQVNATIFHMVWDDIQLSFSSEGSGLWWLRGQDNGGAGENTGIELDVDWRVTQNLRLSGSLYSGDAKYTDDFITLEGEQYLTAGSSMPDSANQKYSLAADYTIPDVFGGDIWLRLDAYYVGPMYSALWRADQANPDSPDYEEGAVEDVASYTKANFQIGYERETWSAIIYARNITDERANTFTGSGASGYATYWGHSGFGETNNLARPRTISMKFTKRF